MPDSKKILKPIHCNTKESIMLIALTEALKLTLLLSTQVLLYQNTYSSSTNI